jgi:hypothetical protein
MIWPRNLNFGLSVQVIGQTEHHWTAAAARKAWMKPSAKFHTNTDTIAAP